MPEQLNHVFVIAEAGVNHNGDFDMARRLVDAAASAGADAIKFQTFRATALVSRSATMAAYQTRALGDAAGTQLAMLQALELGAQQHRDIVAHCEARGIAFLSTPFDLDSAALLRDDLGLKRVKVSSGDLTNAPFLHAMAASGLRLILSCGMALLGDIELALAVCAHGYLGGDEPGRDAFRAAYASPAGQALLRERVSLLHCTTEYPAPLDTVDLRAMDTLARAFGLETGYSDHTEGVAVTLAAVARGARIIEKHLTLDRTLPGPDHSASIEPATFGELCRGVRMIEEALGEGVKRSHPIEERNREVATKSIVAARDIRAGEPFTAANLAVKRPGRGRPPVDWWGLMGRVAARDYAPDEAVDDR